MEDCGAVKVSDSSCLSSIVRVLASFLSIEERKYIHHGVAGGVWVDIVDPEFLSYM